VGADQSVVRPRFARCLGRSLLASLFGLVAGCLLGSALTGIFSLLFSHDHPGGSVGLALYLSMFSILFGAIPVLTYGALGYALLLRFDKAGYVGAAAIGVAPGVLIMAVSPGEFAAIYLGFGLLVALCTHFGAGRLFRRAEAGAAAPA
jgi:hypothetical protein